MKYNQFELLPQNIAIVWNKNKKVYQKNVRIKLLNSNILLINKCR